MDLTFMERFLCGQTTCGMDNWAHQFDIFQSFIIWDLNMLNLKELKQSQLSPGIHINSELTQIQISNTWSENVTEIQMY